MLRGRVALAAVVLSLASSACGSVDATGSATAATSRAHSPTGVVTGYIDACSGLPEPPSAHSGGTVHAVQGSRVLQSQTVRSGHMYRFTLAPGHYTIRLDHYPHGNVPSWIQVNVTAGRTTRADLPNRCK